ncbi:MAG TPA: dTMP kinase [Dehalococcoidia bacterium]|nr:dTMP kinase [Dehalococcoidia bacterium]
MGLNPLAREKNPGDQYLYITITMDTKNIFIVLEGVEGSGKSTQSQILSQRLSSEGVSNLLVREPGSTNTGEKIRALILEGYELNPLTELFLFSAARSELIQNEIIPALDSNTVVVCDRYIYSSFAYQGYAKGLNLDTVAEVNSIATSRISPDLVFLLDINPAVSFERKKAAPKDRFEKESITFHNSVRKGYLCLAESNKNAWHIIDAEKPSEIISEIIWRKVITLLT